MNLSDSRPREQFCSAYSYKTVFSLLNMGSRTNSRVLKTMSSVYTCGHLKFFKSQVTEKAFQLNLYLIYVDHNKLWKTLKEMGIPDHLTCLLRNLYVGQEATVRIGHGTTDGFQIGKGVCQGCILSPCLFNFYAEYIMRNAELEEVRTGIKIAGRNNQ